MLVFDVVEGGGSGEQPPLSKRSHFRWSTVLKNKRACSFLMAVEGGGGENKRGLFNPSLFTSNMLEMRWEGYHPSPLGKLVKHNKIFKKIGCTKGDRYRK